MIAQQVVPGVYRIPLGVVNAFLLDADDLTLVDTGSVGSAEKILSAIREKGVEVSERVLALLHQIDGAVRSKTSEQDIQAFLGVLRAIEEVCR